MPNRGYIHYRTGMLCDHKAFMSPESCFKVLSAAGKPRYQVYISATIATLSTKEFFFCFVVPFLRWPALRIFRVVVGIFPAVKLPP